MIGYSRKYVLVPYEADVRLAAKHPVARAAARKADRLRGIEPADQVEQPPRPPDCDACNGTTTGRFCEAHSWHRVA